MGVTLASHTLRSFLDVTRVLGHSSAVLYLDLSKAFDLAIREAILGMPEGLPVHRYAPRERSCSSAGWCLSCGDQVVELSSHWHLVHPGW